MREGNVQSSRRHWKRQRGGERACSLFGASLPSFLSAFVHLGHTLTSLFLSLLLPPLLNLLLLLLPSPLPFRPRDPARLLRRRPEAPPRRPLRPRRPLPRHADLQRAHERLRRAVGRLPRADAARPAHGGARGQQPGARDRPRRRDGRVEHAGGWGARAGCQGRVIGVLGAEGLPRHETRTATPLRCIALTPCLSSAPLLHCAHLLRYFAAGV